MKGFDNNFLNNRSLPYGKVQARDSNLVVAVNIVQLISDYERCKYTIRISHYEVTFQRKTFIELFYRAELLPS